jgi:hypothetical protein
LLKKKINLLEKLKIAENNSKFAGKKLNLLEKLKFAEKMKIH